MGASGSDRVQRLDHVLRALPGVCVMPSLVCGPAPARRYGAYRCGRSATRPARPAGDTPANHRGADIARGSLVTSAASVTPDARPRPEEPADEHRVLPDSRAGRPGVPATSSRSVRRLPLRPVRLPGPPAGRAGVGRLRRRSGPLRHHPGGTRVRRPARLTRTAEPPCLPVTARPVSPKRLLRCAGCRREVESWPSGRRRPAPAVRPHDLGGTGVSGAVPAGAAVSRTGPARTEGVPRRSVRCARRRTSEPTPQPSVVAAPSPAAIRYARRVTGRNPQ